MRTQFLVHVVGWFVLWKTRPGIMYRADVYNIGFADGKYGLPACEGYDFYWN
jgi:hypothetical protein